MRYWFDTEFIEKPGLLDLISIGIVAEDGRTLYLENADALWVEASEWVWDNVRPHLLGGEAQKPYRQIGKAIREFVGDDPEPQFWGYFADYDWVLFCWLQGRMIDLPKGWPMFCRDIQQWRVEMGIERLPPQNAVAHHALNDALWTRDAWEFLADIRRTRMLSL